MPREETGEGPNSKSIDSYLKKEHIHSSHQLLADGTLSYDIHQVDVHVFVLRHLHHRCLVLLSLVACLLQLLLQNGVLLS